MRYPKTSFHLGVDIVFIICVKNSNFFHNEFTSHHGFSVYIVNSSESSDSVSDLADEACGLILVAESLIHHDGDEVLFYGDDVQSCGDTLSSLMIYSLDY